MQDFEEIIRHASHMKQSQLKKQRQQYESLPDFLKSGMSYSKKYNKLRKQNFYVKMFTSDNLKKQGNQDIKQNKLEEALTKYEQSLSVFRYIQTKTQQNIKDSDLSYHTYQPINSQQQDIFKKHMVSLYLNISLCLTKLNKKDDSIKSVQQAISIDKSNPKCYYRLGQSYLKYINRTEQDIEQGIKQLQKALSLSNDVQIQKQIDKVKTQAQKQNQKSKKTFSFMFNNNELRNSTHSQKDVKKQKLIVQPKQKSRSAEKKPLKAKNQPLIQVKKQQVNNQRCQESKKILMQKEMKLIEEKQTDKRIKTQDKLLKISNKSDWQMHLLQNFILTKGGKIQTLIDFYGFQEYMKQYKTMYTKCVMLHQKTNKRHQKYTDNDGQQVILDFEDKQTKQLVNIQKMKMYSQYMNWLKEHPIEQVKKYIQRYENHRKFIEQKLEQRKQKSDSVSKVFNNKSEQNRKHNMRMFYVAITVVLVWILYRHFIA